MGVPIYSPFTPTPHGLNRWVEEIQVCKVGHSTSQVTGQVSTIVVNGHTSHSATPFQLWGLYSGSLVITPLCHQ